MRDACIAEVSRLAESDPNVMLLTGDLGFKVLDTYRLKFPKQYVNVGVAEQNMAGVACGLALEGKTVFTYSIGNFVSLRCLEQLRNGAAYHGVNVNAISIGAGFSYGALGVSHHATEDAAVLRAIPGVMVVSPGDDLETRQVVNAVAATPGLSLIRLEPSSRALAAIDSRPFHFGKPRQLQAGDELAIVTTGGIAGVCIAAAELLAQRGISTRLLHYHSLRPFDAEAVLRAAAETKALLTVEEHTIDGGLGSVVAEHVLEAQLSGIAFKRLGIRSEFTREVGNQDYLRQLHGLDLAGIVREAEQLLGQRAALGIERQVTGTAAANRDLPLPKTASAAKPQRNGF